MIHLRTMNLQKINELEHYSLIHSLARDENVTRYIAKDFPAWLKKQQSVGDDEIEVGKSYVIVKDHKYIGMIGSLAFSNDGILKLWYTIEKSLRGNGYGEKILAEITPYLIEHVDDLNDIQLEINKRNEASKKVALENGYVKNDSEKDGDIENWYYFGWRAEHSKQNGKSRSK